MATKLDKALYMATKEPDKYEMKYYELFLNSILYVPTWETPPENLAGTVETDLDIYPVVIEKEDKKYIMLFDSKERVEEWTKGREIGMVGMKGFDVFSAFGTKFHFMLNIVSNQAKEFTPEELEWLLSMIEPG